jgi:tRNA dimethylallyltransferase
MTNSYTRQSYIIVGPTASGKSEFAINLAAKLSGVVINADSMQVYKGLEILSSSPSEIDKENTKHLLYNFFSLEENYSLGKYITNLANSLSSITVPSVIVGGTGMYINAAINGIVKIPEISLDVKNTINEEFENSGVEGLFSMLQKTDPNSALHLKPSDKQRIVRALEVYFQTGKSIISFKDNISDPILKNYKLSIIYLRPKREFLYDIINSRFEKFVKMGAIEEVKKLKDKYDNISSSAFKAIGALEFSKFLDAEISLDDAINLSQKKTRNYAKRQYTWFNNQLSSENLTIIEYSSVAEFRDKTNFFINLISCP